MAGRNIKGITIEIGGDTTKLQKSLSAVDKSLKTTQAQLKDIDKLLKFNPGNTELLKQKQEALASSITQTKDRLNQLKDAQKQAADQLKSGKIGQEEFDALQREIIETESKLKNLEKKYKDFGSVAKQQIKEVGNQMKDLGGKMTDVGNSLTKNVTGPIAGLAAGSIAAFKSVDSGYDEMIKKTGATGDAAEELKGILENVATSVPTDFDTAGKAIGEVATRFDVTGDQLDTLSQKFIKFADLNNTDVVSSVDKTQKALSAYGLGADDAEGFLDQMNRVAQNTGVSVEKLADGIVSNGTAFQEMGLDIGQSVAFMGQLEKSGANSETVLNGMRKALKNATKEGKPLNEALSELQQTIESDTEGVGGLTAAYDIFGKSGDQIYGAIKNGTLNFEELATAMTDAGGSVDDTFAEIDDPIKNFQTTLNELKITLAEVAGPLLEILTPAIQKLSEIITTLKEKWESLTPEQQAMIEKIALIVAAIGPLISIIGGLITGAGTLMTVLAALASPIGIVVAAIGAIIAICVLLYKNWDTVKEKAKELAEGFKTAFSAIKDAVVEKIKSIIEWFKAIPEKAKQWGLDLIGNFIAGIKEKFDNVKSTVEGIAGTIADFIGFSEPKKGPLSKFHTFMPDMMQSLAEGIERNKGIVADAMDSLAGGMTVTGSITPGALAENPNDGVLSTLQQYLPYLAQRQAIYLDSGALVGGTAPQMNKALGQMQVRERRR